MLHCVLFFFLIPASDLSTVAYYAESCWNVESCHEHQEQVNCASETILIHMYEYLYLLVVFNIRFFFLSELGL